MNKRQRKKHGISPVVHRIIEVDEERSTITTAQEPRRLPRGFRLRDKWRHFGSLPATVGSYGRINDFGPMVVGDCIDIWSR